VKRRTKVAIVVAIVLLGIVVCPPVVSVPVKECGIADANGPICETFIEYESVTYYLFHIGITIPPPIVL
jgi:hypothetical protein